MDSVMLLFVYYHHLFYTPKPATQAKWTHFVRHWCTCRICWRSKTSYHAPTREMVFWNNVYCRDFIYYVTSKYYIPERSIEKIQQATQTIVENGLSRFFESFSDFLFQLNMNSFKYSDFKTQLEIDYDNDIINTDIILTVDKLKPALIFLVCMMTLSLIVFIIEVIVYHVKKRQNSHRQAQSGNTN